MRNHMYALTGSPSLHAAVITLIICIGHSDFVSANRKMTNREAARTCTNISTLAAAG